MSSTAAGSTVSTRVLDGFRADRHVRERLPGGGLLNLDRRLPWIFVYRRPAGAADAGTERLVLGEAAYLVAEADDGAAQASVRALAEAGTAEFGSFLILELWVGEPDSRSFVVHAPSGPARAVVDALRHGLDELRAGDFDTGVVVRPSEERQPPGMEPLLSTRDCWRIGCLLIGLEVPPIYRDADTGDVYPVFLRRFRQLLSPVLRRAVWEFARVQTTSSFESYRALGPRRFGRALADADRELAEIERSYELLLLVSPINTTAAWTEFRDGGCERAPDFHYRLLPMDPDVLRRRLYAIDLEPIADPAMAFLLHDKRDEIARQITLLSERGSPRFLLSSMQLYGQVDDSLLLAAREILDNVPPPAAPRRGEASVSAAAFATLARAEIEHYRGMLPGLAAEVQIRPDLSGLMVSRGNLLIGDRLALRPARVQPLMHHEVGTHVLTYYNGQAQPLRQLASGLAGYDELQEGLAVFAEYLAGGLDAARMRLLAGRVIAAHSVEQRADFVETFRLLNAGHGFSEGAAYNVTERVHQAGGFTRDLIYLRGLVALLDYLRAGGELEALHVGKIAAGHVDIIDELRARGFLVAPPLVPRLFGLPGTRQRIEAVRRGLTITEMISEHS